MRDRQILRFVSETPWAILPSALAQIRQVVARHAAGISISREEIDEITARARSRDNGGTPPQGVAVLSLWGAIVPHADVMTEMSGGTALDSWLEQFQELANDPSIGTIVLNIDSPGGAVDLVTETAAAIREARKSVDVFAVANTMAASAAYAIASQATELYVSPSGMVGSIGVYLMHEDLSGALEQEGVNVTLIDAPEGGYKTEGNPFEPLSDEALAAKQKIVNDYYRMFVSDVARGRGVADATVEATYGQGRVLTAKDALAAGMVDGIASLEQVISRLVKGQRANGSRALARVPEQLVASSQDFVTGYRLRDVVQADVSGFTFTGTGGGLEITEVSGATGAGAGAPPSRTARESSATRKENQMDTVTPDGGPLTREELLAEQADCKRKLDELDEDAQGRDFTDEEKAEDQRLQARHDEIKRLVATLDERAARRRERAGEIAEKQAAEPIRGDGGNRTPTWGGNSNVGRKGPDDVFDLAAYRRHAGSVDQLGQLWADGAKRANETTRYATDNRDAVRGFVDRVIRASEGKSTTLESFGFRLLQTADPQYEEAFGRWIMGRERGRDTDRIRAAITESGLGGETPVPVTIDPTVLFAGDGSRDPLRTLARVVTITGLTWRGISTEGTVMTYGAEDSAFSPDTPSYDAPDVSVEKAKGEIQFTVEVDTDWPSLREELQRELAQAKMDLEADKFMNGTGTDEPEGLLHALVTDGTSIISSATHDTVTIDDIEMVADDLPANFDMNASWLAHKKFYTKVTSLARAAGVADPWTSLVAGVAPENPLVRGNLHGYPAYAHSEISALYGQADEYVAIIGDFARGFVIVDRVGLNVELDPHPRDSNGAWLGRRALLAWFRNNTALRTPNAFRVLKVKGT